MSTCVDSNCLRTLSPSQLWRYFFNMTWVIGCILLFDRLVLIKAFPSLNFILHWSLMIALLHSLSQGSELLLVDHPENVHVTRLMS